MSAGIIAAITGGLVLAAFVGGYGVGRRKDTARIADLERIHQGDIQTIEDLERIVDLLSHPPASGPDLDRVLDDLVAADAKA